MLVETDMVLYTIWKKVHESPAEFMRLSKSQVDTINAHGVRAGYHPKIYKYNLTAKFKAENVSYEDVNKNAINCP